MSATPSHTRYNHQPNVLVLCDDDILQQIIALCLRECTLEVAPLYACRRTLDPRLAAAIDAAGDQRSLDRRSLDPTAGTYDLIVLALGASRTEPLVALNRAALLDCVGTTPLLVISRRAFEGDPGAGIYHMPFPFDAHDLNRQVKRLAGG